MKTQMMKVVFFIVLSGCYVEEPYVRTTPPPPPPAQPAVVAEVQGESTVAGGEAGAVIDDGAGNVVAVDGAGNAVVVDDAGNRVEVTPGQVVVQSAPAPRPAPGPYDTYPRVMFWPGKVNLHYDVRLRRWMTDPDGVSGAGVNILQYCRKFYPRTVSTRPYQNEWSNAWRDRGNVGYYESMKLSYLCIQR